MHARKILIVGGGTVGWMTAAHLHAVLNRDGRRFADITVLEWPGTCRIATGESTLASFKHFLAVIGVDQVEVMRRSDGTFKQSSKFVNWLRSSDHTFHHPFSLERTGAIDRAGAQWLRSNRSIPFVETISAQPGICEMNLAPQMPGRWDFGAPLPYAYHLDEVKLGEYLRDVVTARGVIRQTDEPGSVEFDGDGTIAAIVTAGGNRMEADLFVDCSGSEALLIDRELHVDWVDCSEWLLCNRLATMQLPYDVHYPGTVRPYTTATALRSGWVREIPLRDRRSLCYVHSADFVEPAAAEDELRQFAATNGDSPGVTFKDFLPGRRENAWVGNCIAIGASASVLDPLESTDLYMVNLAAAMLAEHFPLGDDIATPAFRFNRIMANRFYEIVDFLNLHYCLTRRTDSGFWIAVQESARINARLQAKLDYWRHKPPSQSDFQDAYFPGQPDTPLPAAGQPGDYRSPVDTAGLWNYENYEAVLYGMDFLSRECDEWFGRKRPDAQVSPGVLELLRLAPTRLPPHDVWLKQLFGMPDYPASAAVRK